MALWLIRAGRHGEHEEQFLDESRIYLTWGGLKHDLGSLESMQDLKDLLAEVYPNFSKGKLSNHTGQIWAFSHRIEKGDWIVLPSKQGLQSTSAK